MGKRGFAPKPTKLKLLEGNPGQRKLNDKEAKPKPLRPACPNWLLLEAKKKWRKLVPELESCGLLTVIDGDVLAAYCQTWARWRQHEMAIDKFNKDSSTVSTYMADNGNSKPIPQVAIALKYLKQMQSLARELGLSPSARSNIAVDAAEDDDDWDGLIR